MFNIGLPTFFLKINEKIKTVYQSDKLSEM